MCFQLQRISVCASRPRSDNIDMLTVGIAGVDMHLEPHAYRELHWHQTDEWSLILNGSVRVQATDEAGRTFVDDLQAGDVWVNPRSPTLRDIR